MSPSVFPFQTNVYVCVETQDTNCLFWKYLEEESITPAMNRAVCWEKQRTRPGKISRSLIRAYHSDPLSLGLQIHKQCIMWEQRECLELKIKLVLKFWLENVRHQDCFGPRKNSIHKLLDLEMVPAGQGRSLAVLWSRALKLQPVASAEHEMSEVGHIQPFYNAKQ